ncbi:hypothetical protein CDL15_Pgr026676 [Punica granatum]|uniref:Uncharacterized protein n=1 Tax=Punica granatum TaxID=22663 RepID=A0A218WL66_PUNGR|nr:hypothetical protein CDL15_Pgr026676 [Punica granatum]
MPTQSLLAFVHFMETLHMHNDMEKKIPDSRDLEVPSGVSDGIGSVTEVEEHKAFSKDSLFRNWPLMSTVIVYCVFSLQEIAYNEGESDDNRGYDNEADAHEFGSRIREEGADAQDLGGDQMVFFVLNLIQLLGVVLTFKPFLARPCE